MALLHLSLLATGQQLSFQTGKGRNLRAIAVGRLCFPQVSVESRQYATRAAGHNGRDLRENTKAFKQRVFSKWIQLSVATARGQAEWMCVPN